MNDIININYDGETPTISGRLLHERLEVKTEYMKWFERMMDYGFVEGIDHSSFLTNGEGFGKFATRTDHALTIPMAKEITMLQSTPIGKAIRQYLIKVEESWNTPEMVMARAIKMADDKIKSLEQDRATLAVENSRLTVENQVMQPKADYFDELVDRNLLTSFRDTAKELKVHEKIFIKFLLDHKYIYRDKKGKLTPYSPKVSPKVVGLLEVKECKNDKTGWVGQQTLVTPKGRETFRLLLEGLKTAQ